MASVGEQVREVPLADLRKLFIKNEKTTSFPHAVGDAMIGAGIHDGDTLIVDSAEEPMDGRLVYVVRNGEKAVRRLVHREGKIFLEAANPRFPPRDITDDAEVHILGVVTSALHRF